MANIRDFVFCADGGYVFPLKIAVASLLWACGKDRNGVNVHVLDCGIDDKMWKEVVGFWSDRFGEKFIVTRHIVDMSKLAHTEIYHGSRATYARLMLPEMLKDRDWCLYSDCDTLFLESPLPLFQYCNNETAIVGPNNFKYFGIDEAWFLKNELPFDRRKYVCAGFILMNLKWMREIDFQRKALDFYRTYSNMPTADQCAINYFAYGKVRTFPSEWGAVCPEAAQLKYVPFIHYAGRLPWKSLDNWRCYVDGSACTQKLYRLFVAKITGESIEVTMGEKLQALKRWALGWGVTFLRPFVLRHSWIVTARIRGVFEENVRESCVGLKLAMDKVRKIGRYE